MILKSKAMKTKILTKNGTTETVDLNRRKAIRARCLDCSGFEYNEVSGCKILKCELHPYRMGTENQDPDKRRKAIRAYCLDNCMIGQKSEVAKCTSRDMCPLFAFRLGTRLDRTAQAEKTSYRGIIAKPNPKVR